MKRDKKLGGAEESEKGLVEDSEIVLQPPTERMQSASSPTRQQEGTRPVKKKFSQLENPRDSKNETDYFDDLYANKVSKPAQAAPEKLLIQVKAKPLPRSKPPNFHLPSVNLTRAVVNTEIEIVDFEQDRDFKN